MVIFLLFELKVLLGQKRLENLLIGASLCLQKELSLWREVLVSDQVSLEAAHKVSYEAHHLSESVLEIQAASARDENSPLLNQYLLYVISAFWGELGLGSLRQFLFEQVAVLWQWLSAVLRLEIIDLSEFICGSAVCLASTLGCLAFSVIYWDFPHHLFFNL